MVGSRHNNGGGQQNGHQVNDDLVPTDRYGFVIDAAHRGTLQKSSSMLSLKRGVLQQPPISTRSLTHAELAVREARRGEKWRDMAKRQQQQQQQQQEAYLAPLTFSSSKLLRRAFKGIPDSWRASAWYAFAHNNGRGETLTATTELVDTYMALQLQPCEYDTQIQLDVPRTISDHIFFRKRDEQGQRLLGRVLHGIALYRPVEGYVQGMATIAATLLCYFTEEMAFVMLVQLWDVKGLANFYKPGFTGLFEAFAELEHRLQRTRVGKVLVAREVEVSLYATRWYLCLFYNSLPFSVQLRVWDVLIFYSRPLDVLHATALAILDGLYGRSSQRRTTD